jgi:hypothetical protein
VQIDDADVVPNVKTGLGAFDVAASVTAPEPNTVVVGTVPANAIIWVAVIVSVFVTAVVTAA